MSTIISWEGKSLKLDVTPSEDHGRSGGSTDKVVESGASAQDHQVIKPDTFSLEGFLSEIDKENGISDDHFDKFEELDQARKRKVIFSVETLLKTYPKCTLESLTAKIKQGTGRSLFLSFSFKEWREIVAEETKAPKDSIGKPKKTDTTASQKKSTIKKIQDRYSSKTNKGQVPKQTPSAPQVPKVKAKSSLFKLFG